MEIEVLESKLLLLEKQHEFWETELALINREKESKKQARSLKFSYSFETGCCEKGLPGTFMVLSLISETCSSSKSFDSVKLVMATCSDVEAMRVLAVSKSGTKVFIPKSFYYKDCSKQEAGISMLHLVLYFANFETMTVVPVSQSIRLPKFAHLTCTPGRDLADNFSFRVELYAPNRLSQEALNEYALRNFNVPCRKTASINKDGFILSGSTLGIKEKYYFFFDSVQGTVSICSSVFNGTLGQLVSALAAFSDPQDGVVKLKLVARSLLKTLQERCSKGWHYIQLRSKLKADIAVFRQSVVEHQFQIEVARSVQQSKRVVEILEELKETNRDMALAASKLRETDEGATATMKAVNQDFSLIAKILYPLNEDDRNELLDSLKNLNKTRQENLLFSKLAYLLSAD